MAIGEALLPVVRKADTEIRRLVLAFNDQTDSDGERWD